MKNFKQLIQDFSKKYPHKQEYTERAFKLLEKYQNNPTRPFFRDCFDDGHFTGSMLVVNTEKTKILLMHHKKLGTWQQFGGHADGDTDIRTVAIREFEEESGIFRSDADVSQEILNIDVHLVPAKNAEPEHFHYDISFLALIDEKTSFQKQDLEVEDIQWFELSEVTKELDSGKYSSGMVRMIENI
ncbi:NUDIX hydrolase [Candidatus Gracilibacteria bacterium]|nr:NUDIX hydrolase [Candidatus Gracilibacteria bacterium]